MNEPRGSDKPPACSRAKPGAGSGPKSGAKSGTPESGPRKSSPVGGLSRAFDEARFGADRTLNLRDLLPTGAQAAGRAEAWLRERQAAGCDEVLVITGRGRGSLDGVPIVRDAIVRLFAAMRRVGVIESASEHGTGRLRRGTGVVASTGGCAASPARAEPARDNDPAVLAGLEPDTYRALHRLAIAALKCPWRPRADRELYDRWNDPSVLEARGVRAIRPVTREIAPRPRIARPRRVRVAVEPRRLFRCSTPFAVRLCSTRLSAFYFLFSAVRYQLWRRSHHRVPFRSYDPAPGPPDQPVMGVRATVIVTRQIVLFHARARVRIHLDRRNGSGFLLGL